VLQPLSCIYCCWVFLCCRLLLHGGRGAAQPHCWIAVEQAALLFLKVSVHLVLFPAGA